MTQTGRNIPATRDGGTELLAPVAPRRAAPRRSLKYLTHAVHLEEAGPPRFLSVAIILAGSMVAAGVAWATFTDVTSSAQTAGTVVPSDAIHPVKHLEGGIVDEIMVRNGDSVEAGDVLVRLDDAVHGSDLDQLEARRAFLGARALRLRAEINGQAESFESLTAGFPDLVRDQSEILEAARASFSDEQQILSDRLVQRELETAALREQVLSLEAQLTAIREQARIREGLFKKGIGSRISVLEIQREVARLRGALGETRFGMRQAESATAEAANAQREHVSRWRNERVRELETVTAELAEVRQSLALFRDRVARLDVRAPVGGVVNLLAVAGPGAVVAPGETLLEIVPSDQALVVEVDIDSRDIGYVSPGQSVDVSVRGFDVSRYGTLRGRLEWVSANSNSDESGRIFYAARVALEGTELNHGADHRKVVPGMAAQASINTGTQSLLNFLIRPVASSLRFAFAER